MGVPVLIMGPSGSGKSASLRNFKNNLLLINVINKPLPFRKNSIYKIISNEEYVVIAKDGNKIYFKEANRIRGFKLGNWTPNVKCFKVMLSKFPLREEDLGEYNLEFDTNLGLHYICLNRKLEKQLNWEGR